ILIVIIKIGLDVLDWNYTLYTLTEQRVIIRRGFFHKEKIAMSYSKIQDIEVSQSIIERILNCGNMIIYGGHDNSETILDAVPNPSKVEDIVMNKISNVQSDSYRGYSNFNSTYDPRFNKYNTQSNNYQQDYQYDNYNQNFDNQRDYRGIQEENTKTSKWKQMMGDKKKSKRELDEIINKHQNRFKKYK
ncbi:PH domain-containing protein, partial [Methanosphaera stadtmanae]